MAHSGSDALGAYQVSRPTGAFPLSGDPPPSPKGKSDQDLWVKLGSGLALSVSSVNLPAGESAAA